MELHHRGVGGQTASDPASHASNIAPYAGFAVLGEFLPAIAKASTRFCIYDESVESTPPAYREISFAAPPSAWFREGPSPAMCFLPPQPFCSNAPRSSTTKKGGGSLTALAVH